MDAVPLLSRVPGCPGAPRNNGKVQTKLGPMDDLLDCHAIQIVLGAKKGVAQGFEGSIFNQSRDG